MKPDQGDVPSRKSLFSLPNDRLDDCCPVCLEAAALRQVAEIPCGHAVHVACLRLLAASGQAECPVCRRVFDPKLAAASRQLGQLEHDMTSLALLRARNDVLRSNIIENQLRLGAELKKAQERILTLKNQERTVCRKRELLEASIRFAEKQHSCQAAALNPAACAEPRACGGAQGQAAPTCGGLPLIQNQAVRKHREEAAGYANNSLAGAAAASGSCSSNKEIAQLALQLRNLDLHRCEIRRELDKLTDLEAMQRMMLERTQRAYIMCYYGEVKASALKRKIKSQLGSLETQHRESLDNTVSGLHALPPLAAATGPGEDALDEERLREQRSAERTGRLACLGARLEKIAGRGYIL